MEYNVRAGKKSEFSKFLKSETFRQILDEPKSKTGIRILDTYFAVDPSSHEMGDYGWFDIWELPNYAAIDKYVQSKARVHFSLKVI